jgi:hypothetical protein
VVRLRKCGFPIPPPSLPAAVAADAVALFHSQQRCLLLRREKREADREKAPLTTIDDDDQAAHVLASFLRRVWPTRWRFFEAFFLGKQIPIWHKSQHLIKQTSPRKSAAGSTPK